MLIFSAALGVWALTNALAIGGVLGSLFFAAAFLGLAFDVIDLFRLTSGELSPEDYLVEMAVGLLLEAGLGGLGEVLRRVGVGNLSKSVIERVVRQLDEWTGGITAQLRRTCAYAADSVPQQICPGLSAEEIVEYSQFVTTKGAWESLAGLSELITSRGGDGGAAVRRLLRNKEALKGGSDRIEAIARIILDAPKVPGFDEVVERALDQNRGFPYELRRAIALHDPENGVRVVAYGRTERIEFKRVVSVEVITEIDPVTGNQRRILRPVLGKNDSQLLEGDVVLEVTEGDQVKTVFVDTKHGPQSDGKDTRVWNQIRKAAEALRTGEIDEYRFESSRSMLQVWKDYVDELSSSSDYKDMNPSLNELLEFVVNLRDDI